MNNPFKRRVSDVQDGAAAAALVLHADGFIIPGVAESTPREQRATTRSARHSFGKPINHVQPFMASALHNFTLVAPVLLIAAITLSVLAVVQASSFISAFTRQVKSEETNKLAPLIDKKPLIAADYQSAANVIAKNNSAVLVGLTRNRTGIVISIKEASLLPEFVFALATIQSYRQGVAWNAGQICLNKCDAGVAASAEITGYTQAISFFGLRGR